MRSTLNKYKTLITSPIFLTLDLNSNTLRNYSIIFLIIFSFQGYFYFIFWTYTLFSMEFTRSSIFGKSLARQVALPQHATHALMRAHHPPSDPPTRANGWSRLRHAVRNCILIHLSTPAQENSPAVGFPPRDRTVAIARAQRLLQRAISAVDTSSRAIQRSRTDTPSF